MAAHKYVIVNEGGYVCDPDDPGGETYRGITRKNFPNEPLWENLDALKPLSHGEIVDSTIIDSNVNVIYKKHFWDRMKGDLITSQKVATYLYDWFVNSGSAAIRELQKILVLPEDGAFGSQTLAEVNKAEDGLLEHLHEARKNFYERIAVNGSAKFLNGWLNRANYMFEVLG